MVEETNKDAVAQKYDTEKPAIFEGFFKYFPRAIEEVAKVSGAGSRKYAEGKYPTKWAEVPNGENRYGNALLRHMIEEVKGNAVDSGIGGTNCLHLAQEAWNALARLELYLRMQSSPSRLPPENPCLNL